MKMLTDNRCGYQDDRQQEKMVVFRFVGMTDTGGWCDKRNRKTW